MMKKHKNALVLLRRDLRLQDHGPLTQACTQAENVSIGFCFDPRQTDKTTNPYFSKNAFEYLIESLKELDQDIEKTYGARLQVHVGDPMQVMQTLSQRGEIDAIYVSSDVSPFSKARDAQLRHVIPAFYSDPINLFLTQPGDILSGAGTPYKVYSAFAKKARTQPMPSLLPVPQGHFTNNMLSGAMTISDYIKAHPYVKNPYLGVTPGRAAAVQALGTIATRADYKEVRDLPAVTAGTTRLSPALKFGVVSPREVFWEIKKTHGDTHTLINELYWRDFFGQILYHFPQVLQGDFRPDFKDISWNTDEEAFDRWCQGKTGFPIVDAGMRELNQTGFMHNRVRMIVASFLVKNMHQHWRRGERYFATKLVDYDPAANNGNWQWAASTGTDAQPYFRVFNAWTQQKRFDPQCEYIKRWIPELQSHTPKEIQQWEKKIDECLFEGPYPAPMLSHKATSARAKSLFKAAKERYSQRT